MKIKMYAIFCKEAVDKMKGSRGKLAAQAGHAFLHSFWNATEEYIGEEGNLHPVNYQKFSQATKYRNSSHAYKIGLIVDNEDQLKELQEKYSDICGTSLVTDAGFTVFNEPTITCLGIGPIQEDNIGDDLKALKIFS